jgi:hypothetical protein
MNTEMRKVNDKINHLDEIMTNFIAQLSTKSLQVPEENPQQVKRNTA